MLIVLLSCVPLSPTGFTELRWVEEEPPVCEKIPYDQQGPGCDDLYVCTAISGIAPVQLTSTVSGPRWDDPTFGNCDPFDCSCVQEAVNEAAVWACRPRSQR